MGLSNGPDAIAKSSEIIERDNDVLCVLKLVNKTCLEFVN